MARYNKRIKRSVKILTNKQKREIERVKLEQQVLKESRKANARLKSLSRKGRKGTWASKKLFNRIDTSVLKAITPRGRIKVQKGLTSTQLLQLSKAIKQFMTSKTSTNAGINQTKKETIKSIGKSLSLEGEEVTEDDAEFFYDMLSDDTFSFFADKLSASTVWVLIDEAISAGDTQDQFLSRMNQYITLEDLDIREKAISIYNKYVV